MVVEMNIQPDTTLMALIVGIVEFAKIYLPDNIEPKILPALSVTVGISLGVATNNGWLVGLVSGLMASGSYKLLTKFTDKIGGSKQ